MRSPSIPPWLTHTQFCPMVDGKLFSIRARIQLQGLILGMIALE